MDYEESVERAAAFYLCENLPEDWINLPEGSFLEFLAENAWEPYEYTSGETLWGYIEELAQEFILVDNLARQKALTGR
jgi:hypothetical protein